MCLCARACAVCVRVKCRGRALVEVVATLRLLHGLRRRFGEAANPTNAQSSCRNSSPHQCEAEGRIVQRATHWPGTGPAQHWHWPGTGAARRWERPAGADSAARSAQEIVEVAKLLPRATRPALTAHDAAAVRRGAARQRGAVVRPKTPQRLRGPRSRRRHGRSLPASAPCDARAARVTVQRDRPGHTSTCSPRGRPALPDGTRTLARATLRPRTCGCSPCGHRQSRPAKGTHLSNSAPRREPAGAARHARVRWNGVQEATGSTGTHSQSERPQRRVGD